MPIEHVLSVLPNEVAAIERALAKHERHIGEGQEHVNRQVEIVEKMRAGAFAGLTLAEQVLKTLRQCHELQLKHRDLLRREADNLPRDNQLSEGLRVTIAACKGLTE